MTEPSYVMPNPPSKPLSERKSDWFFVLVFATFASTSFMWDATVALGIPLEHDSWYWPARMLADHYVYMDPLLAANPAWFRVLMIASAFVWGPFYVVLSYAFAKGKNWIRIPAIMYGSALTFGMAIILGEEFFGALRTPHPLDFLAFNLPYKLVPIALLVRMRKPFPFS